MSLLQIFFILSAIILLILSIDISKKQRFNAVHFFVFVFIGVGLLLFTFFPGILDFAGRIFGLQRGADLLVYSSIIFLIYFVLLLLSKHFDNRDSITGLVRELAIQNSDKKIIKGKEVFVIPAYNEGKVLVDTIKNIQKNGYKNILVINDGSTDKTRDNLSKLKDIVFLNHYKNRGQGAALETGFEYLRRYSDVKYVITFDSDGQHDLKDLKEFEKYLKNHPEVDVLLGNRFKGKKHKGIPLSRRIILKLGIIFTFFVSSIRLSDTHNGYRLIKSRVLDKFKITIDGMGHASEIIDIISINNLTYKEVPVNIKYTNYSLSKGQSSGNAISIAFRFIWSKFFR